jgi:hypothetical protein
MQASLALSRGTLFVGVSAKTARVRSFDLGGRPLGTAFAFRDARARRSSVSGIAVDADRAIWIADAPAERVRVFSLFGRETRGLDAPRGGAGDARAPVLPGVIARPVVVEVEGGADHGWVAIACGGERRHAVQLFEPDFTFRASLAALGDPNRPFGNVTRIAARGERLYVAEALARTVQVFRAGEFLFAFSLTARGGERYEPSAVAPVDAEGAAGTRLVVACRAPESGLFLGDASGRVVRQLAVEGEHEGAVLEPSDVVVEPGADDRHARVFVIDRDGLRVQVFTLEGHCLGVIPLDETPRDLRGNEGGR